MKKNADRRDYTILAMEWVSPVASTLTDENRIKGVDAAFNYIKKNYTKRSYILATACFLMGIAFTIASYVVKQIMLG